VGQSSVTIQGDVRQSSVVVEGEVGQSSVTIQSDVRQSSVVVEGEVRQSSVVVDVELFVEIVDTRRRLTAATDTVFVGAEEAEVHKTTEEDQFPS